MSKRMSIGLCLLLLFGQFQYATAATFGIDLRASASQISVGASPSNTNVVTNLQSCSSGDVTVANDLRASVSIGSVAATRLTTWRTNGHTLTFAVGPMAF